MQPPINPSNLSPEQEDELIVQLFEQIAKFTGEINELKSRLSKNSRNSSKLPSSDGYGKPKPKKPTCKKWQKHRWSEGSPRQHAQTSRASRPDGRSHGNAIFWMWP